MSLVHKSVVLQALSSFTGTTVKPMTDKTDAGNELDVFNFLPTTFAEAGDEPDSLFSDLYVDMKTFLDPKFDYDFTHLKDNSKCKRGDEPYERPCGWKRLAIKVLDKYPDGNAWLGKDGWRSHSVSGEWPVSYYGTNMKSAKDIVANHYKLSLQEKYGEGIYSSFDINKAAKYSKEVKCEETGKTYKVLLQNRINPDMRKVIEGKKYWLIEVPAGTPSAKEKQIVEKAIRPYGMLFKEV